MGGVASMDGSSVFWGRRLTCASSLWLAAKLTDAGWSWCAACLRPLPVLQR